MVGDDDGVLVGEMDGEDDGDTDGTMVGTSHTGSGGPGHVVKLYTGAWYTHCPPVADPTAVLI